MKETTTVEETTTKKPVEITTKVKETTTVEETTTKKPVETTTKEKETTTVEEITTEEEEIIPEIFVPAAGVDPSSETSTTPEPVGNTGDDSNSFKWILLLLVSAFILSELFIPDKKNR